MEIAIRAESLGFSTLATIGRIAYPTYEELVTLAAAAGATSRIGLMTDIVLAATREPALLAKQAATLDQISSGRFVLGIGSGARSDDFAVVGADFHSRGRRLDAALDLMHRAWRGEALPGSAEAVAPRPVNGHSVPTMFGGYTEKTVERIVRYGVGYTLGGGQPDALKGMMERINGAWSEARREGRPRFVTLSYYALGDDAAGEAEQNLLGYYGDSGPRIWGAAVRTAEQAKERVRMFESVGCDELILFMAAPAIEQVGRLAEAVL